MSDEFPVCGCVTCGDVAVELTVIEYDATTGIARCADPDRAGDLIEVDAALIDGVAAGSCLLVHAGTAIALVAGVPA